MKEEPQRVSERARWKMVPDSSSRRPCQSVEHHGRTVLLSQIQIPAASLTSGVASGKFLNLSGPLKNNNDSSAHLMGCEEH